jgi:4,4'-diaponeurosporenoate glycosyltransferase
VTGFRIGLVIYAMALWFPALYCLWRLPRCPGPRRPPDGRRVSVIVPARDEELRIAPLLESLAGQSRPADEIFVVDDGSTDRTAELSRALGATVITAPAKPDGWTGKTWACWIGSGRATGDLLVFLDADTVPEADGMERLAAAHAEHGGLVSVQPYHVVKRPYEQLSAFFNALVMGSVGAFTPFRGRRPAAGSFGPCLLLSREDYLSLGGHEAVRREIVEDMALGALAGARGLAVTNLAGRGTISFRMYPDGLAGVVEGWSKSMATGAARSPALPRALMSAWITGATTSVMALGMGLAALAGGGAADAAFACAALTCYLLYAVELWWVLRRIGSFGPLTSLLFPLPLAFFMAVFARSVWLSSVRGAVTWRGRSIPVQAALRLRGSAASTRRRGGATCGPSDCRPRAPREAGARGRGRSSAAPRSARERPESPRR